MATSSVQARCSTCNEERDMFLCRGCSKDFCFDHLIEHRQFLKEQLGLIQNDYNQFRQNLIDLRNNPLTHPSIKQIDQWENESILKIKEKANEYRQLLINYTNESINHIERQLNDTNEQFSSNEKKKDFNEIHLDKLKQKFEKLNEQLYQSITACIEQKSNSFITEISIRSTSMNKQFFIPTLNIKQTWEQNATTIAGGHGYGRGSNQLNNPSGMFIDNDQTIFIADSDNHRILEWKKNSDNFRIVAGDNGKGNRCDQLNFPTKVIIDQENDSFIICDRGNRRVVTWPRQTGRTVDVLISNIDCYDLTMDDDGYLYVSDTEKHEIIRRKIGETNGTIVAGGNRKGNRTDQLHTPYYLFIDKDHSVYVSDYYNHRVMKWMKGAREGIVVAGVQGQGNGLGQLSYPCGIVVDQLGTLYVADYSNHRVMRWLNGAEQGTIVVGGNGRGGQPNQFREPIDLLFDRENNLYVVEYYSHRVQRFHAN